MKLASPTRDEAYDLLETTLSPVSKFRTNEFKFDIREQWMADQALNSGRAVMMSRSLTRAQGLMKMGYSAFQIDVLKLPEPEFPPYAPIFSGECIDCILAISEGGSKFKVSDRLRKWNHDVTTRAQEKSETLYDFSLSSKDIAYTLGIMSQFSELYDDQLTRDMMRSMSGKSNKKIKII